MRPIQLVAFMILVVLLTAAGLFTFYPPDGKGAMDGPRATESAPAMSAYFHAVHSNLAVIWNEIAIKTRAGDFDIEGLEGLQRYLGANSTAAKDQAFDMYLEPRIQQLNGPRWDPVRAAAGADDLSDWYERTAKQFQQALK